MYVEMLATAAGPDGVLHMGQVYNLPRKQAEELCKVQLHGRAYARKFPGKPGTVSEISRPEIADSGEGDE